MPGTATQTIYCGDNLDKLQKLPDGCVDLIYIDPPFNSNRNYEVFWGETKEKRAFEDRHESTEAYIDFMRPRCVELHRVLKKTGSFYFHCDWHASHYVKVMLDQIFGESNFQNEIIWKRTTAHSDAKQGSKHSAAYMISCYSIPGDRRTTPGISCTYRYNADYIKSALLPDDDEEGRRYSDRTSLVTPGRSGQVDTPITKFSGQ